MGTELFTKKQRAPRGKHTSLMPLVAHELRRDGKKASKKVVRRRSDNADFGKLRLFQQVTSLGARSNAHWYCTSVLYIWRLVWRPMITVLISLGRTVNQVPRSRGTILE
jgi:hypothetical protein